MQPNPEYNLNMWKAIGLSTRLKATHEEIWDALVEKGKWVVIFADGELIGEFVFPNLKALGQRATEAIEEAKQSLESPNGIDTEYRQQLFEAIDKMQEQLDFWNQLRGATEEIDES